MSKIIMALVLSASFLFAAINLQTATKEELMTIKGIGPKKAEQIIEYRKKNKIANADDLKNIKGFGDGVVTNVKKDIKVSSNSSNPKEKIEKTKEVKKKETKEKVKETKQNSQKKIEEKINKK